MKRLAIFLLFVLVVFFGFKSYGIDKTYCAKPPFIQTVVPANIMLVLDYSGSMGWAAYADRDPNGATDYQQVQTDNGVVISYYHPNKTYYGYFKPDARYSEVNEVWQEDPNGYYSGNWLNWKYMKRIDILRWILTGGKVLGRCIAVKECDDFTTYSECAANNWHGGFCYWKWLGWKSGCRRYWYKRCSALNECSESDLCTSGESVVELEDGQEIRIEDVSSYDNSKGEVVGVLQKIREQEQRPRIGAVFFSSNVFERIKLSDEYTNLINAINNTSPSGATCTKCAIDEMKDLFSEDSYAVDKYGDPYKWGVDNQTIRCAKNFLIVMSDGEWNTPDESTDSDPIRPIDTMWKGGNADLVRDLDGKQNVRTYSVAMFQSLNSSGTRALKWMAVYGNYLDLNDNGYPCNVNSYPNTSLTIPENLENQSQCNEVQKNKDGNGPYGFFSGSNPAELKTAIMDVFNEILKQASSGTATSILSEKEKVNAGILQAAFYPQKIFTSGDKNYKVDWIGSLYDWWFYYTETGSEFKANMREDTIVNKDLDICNNNGTPGGDYIIDYVFEDNKLKINAFRSSCEGDNVSSTPDEVYNGLDEAHYVWEAGEKLALESPTDRVIYTYIKDSRPSSPKDLVGLDDISSICDDNCSKLFGDDNVNGIIDDDNETYKYAKEISFNNLINYIYGEDVSGYRERVIDNDNNTWKLGDIVYSTPKVVNYDNFSVAFVGANDGMLHAFLVGKYRYDNLGVHQLVKLRDNITSNGTSELGKELWAFVPKNALPYLRFLADPDYCHMYYVDLTPTIYEIKDNFGRIEKRVLVDGMRLGGAVGCDNASVCINPPKDTCDNTSSSSCLGLSSYFALDITNPLHPKFLWEFTDPDLGFSYSGPTLIKEYNLDNNTMRYYIMFASGPTDYKGESGQDLDVFILELNDDFTIKSVIKKDLSDSFTDLKNAFAGEMSPEGIVDKDFSSGKMVTKAVFFGVVYNDNSSWKGNVIGVKGLNSGDPKNWQFFELFKNPIGPVVVPISYYRCGDKWFLYFGTGRYFYRDDDPDNSTGGVNKLYGIKIDKCINSSGTSFCTLGNGDLYASNDSCYHISDDLYGWYQDLDPAEDNYNKERDITGTTLSSTGAVFFTTTEPTSDICGFGGRSRMWGLNCASGQSLVHQTCQVTGNIVGVLLLQTSVGKITAFNVNINPNNPEGSVNPFVKVNEKATNWTVGTAPPNKSALVERPTRSPAQILYEIEK